MCKLNFGFIVWLETDEVCSKTGEWKGIKGKTYKGIDAKTTGNAFKQEAVRPHSLTRPLEPKTLH